MIASFKLCLTAAAAALLGVILALDGAGAAGKRLVPTVLGSVLCLLYVVVVFFIVAFDELRYFLQIFARQKAFFRSLRNDVKQNVCRYSLL